MNDKSQYQKNSKFLVEYNQFLHKVMATVAFCGCFQIRGKTFFFVVLKKTSGIWPSSCEFCVHCFNNIVIVSQLCVSQLNQY